MLGRCSRCHQGTRQGIFGYGRRVGHGEDIGQVQDGMVWKRKPEWFRRKEKKERKDLRLR